MRILIVEDDPMIGAALRRGLQQEGYSVDWIRDGRGATTVAETEPYALLILDLGLPGKDGMQVLAGLRRRHRDVPVIIVTARDSRADRIKGLDLGADDYVVKPFDLDELGARIRAVLRRHAGRAEPLISHGPLEVNTATHEVTCNGTKTDLTAREFALLEALLERPGTILSRAALEQRLYGWDEEVGSNAVEVHIHNLRRKLGENIVRNVRGVGYTLGPVTSEQPARESRGA
ncbi:MAG: response regulator [Chromatiales bacterium]